MSNQTNEPEQVSSNSLQSWSKESMCAIQPGQRLRPGMRCPRCKQAALEYNGLLNLVCPNCGLTEAGACT